MIGPHGHGFIVDCDASTARTDEHQHVDFVVDVRPDFAIGVEADQVGIEVTSVRQTPHCTTGAERCSAEIHDYRLGGSGNFVAIHLAIVSDLEKR